MVVVFANFGGPSGGLRSGGRSAILSDKGIVLARLPAVGSGIAIAIEDERGWRTREVMVAGA
jgi:hypothetical protein